MNYQIISKDHQFILLDDHQQPIGEIDYHLDEKNRYVITHTFVDSRFRGQGLANRLLDQVIEKAQKEKRYIYPICSFAVKVLQHEKYRALWDPAEGEPSGGACTWNKR